jgi:hypothetical protein
MTTTTGAAFLLAVLLLAVYKRIISSFLVVFSLMVILAAYSLIPVFAWSSLQILGITALWVELAQIEGKKDCSNTVLSLSKDEQLRRLSWAAWGFVCGGLIAFLWGVSFILSLAGAFTANVLLALIEDESFAVALKRALLIVDEEPAGSVMKSGFCLIILISLLVASIA